MRSIKFRAWNIITKTMIDLKAITPFALNMDAAGLFIPFSDGLPLMQFTGLLDKEGRETYEGYIIQCKSEIVNLISKKNTGKFKIRNYEVRWENDQGRWGRWADNKFEPLSGLNKLHLLKWYKIIGNIYENPELLTI